MIALEGVTEHGLMELSLLIQAGETAAFVTEDEYEKDVLLEMLLGLRRPAQGRVIILGEDLYALVRDKALALMARVGFVSETGGLISNLKVWENIVLPLWYHKGVGPEESEEAAIGILKRLGIADDAMPRFLSGPPGDLPEHERRIAAFARAALMEPDIMIYDSPFEGMGHGWAMRFQAVLGEFHGMKPGRTSLYVSAGEPPAVLTDAKKIYRLQEGRITA